MDRRSSFSFLSGGFGQNVLIFGADMSSSIHGDKKKDILVLGRGPTQGLESTLTAEKMYSINFTVTKKSFVRAYIIKEQMVIYLLMAQKCIHLKQKILQL